MTMSFHLVATVTKPRSSTVDVGRTTCAGREEGGERGEREEGEEEEEEEVNQGP